MDNNGIVFQFKFPTKGLSLRSVSIEDVPTLTFDASNPSHLPTLTEEDVAVVARLVTEGKRPEFYYIGFPPLHPFFGRQYKAYRPQWLRGTSVGDLQSEADWTMKCLGIGARSNDDKTEFWGWEKTSKLTGLATALDFFKDKPSGSVIMSCKSVEVEKTDKTLTFVGEPAMTIKSDDSSSYTDYITTHYDSIAYHDEPLFLKMKELIKLILAMEWLIKEQGVKFNNKWMTERTQQKNPLSTKAIEIVDTTATENLLNVFAERFPIPPNETQKIMTPLGSVQLDINSKIEKTETGCIIEITKSTPDLPIEETITIRASTNDYNMLYEGFDLKQPIAISSGDLIVPDVSTWSELFAETVPRPTLWIFPYDGDGIATFTGGVSTQNIPVNTRVPISQPVKNVSEESTKVVHNQYVMGGNKVQVKGSTEFEQEVRPLRKRDVPTRQKFENPPTVVPCETRAAQKNRKCKKSGMNDAVGWQDQAQKHICSRDGEQILKQVGLRASVQRMSTSGRAIDESNISGIIKPPLGAVEQPMDTQPPSIPPQLPAAAPKGSPTPSIASSESGYESLTSCSSNGRSSSTSTLASTTSSELHHPLYFPQQGATGISTPDLLSPTDSVISISNESHGDDEESTTEIEDNYEPDGGQ